MAVRRESVRLDVEGNFDRKMMEYATATEALKHSLKDLSGTSVSTSRSQDGLGRSVDGVDKSTQRTTKSTKEYALEQAILDERTRRVSKALQEQAKASVDAEQGIQRVRSQTQGLKKDAQGLNLLWSAVGATFPVVAPLGAVGAAGLGGIANDAGMGVVGVGSLVLAFHGLGATLKSVNKAALDPTAANLAAAQKAMQELSPSARKFVTELQGMRPLLAQIQGSAQSGWFPGLTQALHNLIPLAPVIEKIFHDVGAMGGHLAAQGANALAGPQWASFFKFIDAEAPKAMAALGHVVGSLTHGLAQLWMAFSPLNNGFNNWLVGAAKGFDSWATGLSKTQGFHDFIAYVDQNGPKVAAAMGAIANAVIQIVQAAAPLGGPTLDAITAIAKVLGFIANSPLGTPIMALIQMATVARIATKAMDALRISTLLTGRAGAAAGATGAAGAAARGSQFGGPVAALLALGGYDEYKNAKDTFTGHQSVGAGLLNVLAPSIMTARVAANALGITIPGLTQKTDDLSKSTGHLGNTMQDTAKKVRVHQAALRDANRQTADSFVNLANDMKKPTLSLDKLVARWRSQAAAEAAMGKNIATALARGANPQALSKIIDQLGPEAGLAIQQLARGGKKGIADLNAAFHGGQHAANVYNGTLSTLSKTMLGIPKHVTPVVRVSGADAALSQMQRLRALIAGNPITQSIVVKRVGQDPRSNVGLGSSSLPGVLLGQGKADGGTVPKDGRPYADRHLYLLADGEEVISNRDGQADRHRTLLKAINANRMASGGTVGRSYGGASSTVRHVIEVKVVGGEFDLTKARQQIHGIAREISRDEIDQQSTFDSRTGR